MKSKSFLYPLLAGVLLWVGCTKEFDEINTDPNNPKVVPSSSLMTNAQKNLMDDIRDEWFSGRQSYLYAQYFAQRTYTEEDRYSLRQTTNNTYWILIYNDIKDLQEVIDLNTDPATKVQMSAYGNNENQIAAARILKAWAFQILTDAYGDIPYTEALQGETILTPKYTPQAEIYADLIKELTEASNQINVDEPAFTQGDIIYGGDAEKWKKFANSLKMRVALRASNVPGWNYRQYIQEAVTAGVFESNDDNAVFQYIGRAPNNAPLYDAFYTAGRNDFTLSHTFVNLLKGENDVLNAKTNPFQGLFDPRLAIWADPPRRQELRRNALRHPQQPGQHVPPGQRHQPAQRQFGNPFGRPAAGVHGLRRGLLHSFGSERLQPGLVHQRRTGFARILERLVAGLQQGRLLSRN
jgi:hypothetical protein